MYFGYVILPFCAWLIAGGTKFVVNCIRERRWAFDLIGYGGLPSNHSAIVSSVPTLIALREGVGHPAFGVALSLAFIVILDANSLRKQVGLHAAAINQLTSKTLVSEVSLSLPKLRERIGHTVVEIAVGIAVGGVSALVVYGLLS